MKKTLLICLGILLVTGIALSLLDSSEYALERNLWKARKDFQAIVKDPQATPAVKYKALIDKYQKMIDRNPGSRYLPLLYSQKGRVYFLQENYEAARAVFEEALKLFPDDKRQVEMLLAIGMCYEKEEKMDKVLEVYKRVQTGFPETDLDITMPLYIADFYLRAGQLDKHRQALADAVVFYRSEIQNEGDETRKLKSMRSLAAAYMAQEQWQNAIGVLKETLFSVAVNPKNDPRQALVMVNAIARISAAKLHDPDIAIGIIQSFLAKYPEHPGKRYLKKVVAGLQGNSSAVVETGD